MEYLEKMIKKILKTTQKMDELKGWKFARDAFGLDKIKILENEWDGQKNFVSYFLAIQNANVKKGLPTRDK